MPALIRLFPTTSPLKYNTVVMRRLLNIIWVVVLFVVFLSSSQKASAATCPGLHQGVGNNVLLPIYTPGASHTVVIDTSTFNKNYNYYFKVKNGSFSDDEAQTPSFRVDASNSITDGCNQITVDATNNKVTWVISCREALQNAGDRVQEKDPHYVIAYRWEAGSNRFCDVGAYYTSDNVLKNSTCKLVIWQGDDSQPGMACYAPGCIEKDKDVTIRVDELKINNQPYNGNVSMDLAAGGTDIVQDRVVAITNGIGMTKFPPRSKTKHSVIVKVRNADGGLRIVPGCRASFNVSDYCSPNQCNKTRTVMTPGDLNGAPFKICDQIDSGLQDSQGRNMKNLCIQCIGGDEEGREGMWTALGCIPRQPEQIVKRFLLLGLGMGGGVALLMILVAGFQISTSQGNPEQFNKAKEMLVGAITGLLFIIFSVTILQFIGYSILKIPGFGG